MQIRGSLFVSLVTGCRLWTARPPASLPAHACACLPACLFTRSPIPIPCHQVRHTDAEWRQLLPADSYAVLRQARTERRFSSPLNDVSALPLCGHGCLCSGWLVAVAVAVAMAAAVSCGCSPVLDSADAAAMLSCDGRGSMPCALAVAAASCGACSAGAVLLPLLASLLLCLVPNA